MFWVWLRLRIRLRRRAWLTLPLILPVATSRTRSTGGVHVNNRIVIGVNVPIKVEHVPSIWTFRIRAKQSTDGRIVIPRLHVHQASVRIFHMTAVARTIYRQS